MTTPERFRRRQRIEGTALIILGIFTIAISFYFRAEDARQRACFVEQFHDLSSALTKRGQLVDRDSHSTKRAILDGLSAKRAEDIRRTRDLFIAQQARIELQRRQNPVPPFPEGACE